MDVHTSENTASVSLLVKRHNKGERIETNNEQLRAEPEWSVNIQL